MASEPRATSSFERAQQVLAWQGPLHGTLALAVRQKVEALMSVCEGSRLTAGACGEIWIFATNSLPLSTTRLGNAIGLGNTAALRPDTFAGILQAFVFLGGCRLVRTVTNQQDTDAPIWLDCAPDTSTCQNGFDSVGSDLNPAVRRN